MNIIFFNPLASNKKGKDITKELEVFLQEKGEMFIKYDLTEIDVREVLESIPKPCKIILVGGDGTLNRFFNNSINFNDYEFYLWASGSGNDFKRSFKGDLPLINPEIRNFPSVLINNEKKRFINGIGLGLDGYICERVHISKKKSPWNFFKQTIIAFLKFKKFSAFITIDEKEYSFRRLWLVSVMHGKYYGGGMKINPDGQRNDEFLEVCLVRRMPFFILIFLFPLIYLGWHKYLKFSFKILKGKKITIKTSRKLYAQIDGEILENIEMLETV